MSPKVSIAAVSGAITAIIMLGLQTMTGGMGGEGSVEVPPGLEAAVTTIVMFIIGYLVPEKWHAQKK